MMNFICQLLRTDDSGGHTDGNNRTTGKDTKYKRFQILLNHPLMVPVRYCCRIIVINDVIIRKQC